MSGCLILVPHLKKLKIILKLKVLKGFGINNDCQGIIPASIILQLSRRFT